MTTTPTWLDKVRIERKVRTIDLLTQDLPRRSRLANRRELRANLHAASSEIGVDAALRRLGNPRRVAADYLDAHYSGRRPHWLSGLAWALAAEVFLLALGFAGQAAFTAGIGKADSTANGTYAWDGLLPGIAGEVTFTHGQANAFTFTFSAGMLLYLLVAFVLGSRIWRLRL